MEHIANVNTVVIWASSKPRTLTCAKQQTYILAQQLKKKLASIFRRDHFVHPISILKITLVPKGWIMSVWISSK